MYLILFRTRKEFVMKRYLSKLMIVLLAAMMLAGCASTEDDSSDDGDVTYVEITDAHGTVSVPVNPEVVVSLDNRTFETLDDWGI